MNYDIDIQATVSKLNKVLGAHNVLGDQLRVSTDQLNSLSDRETLLSGALELFQHCSVIGRNEIRKTLVPIVNSVLHTLFGDEYSFDINWVFRRNSWEADFITTSSSDNLSGEPMEDFGGGVADVIANAMLMAFLTKSSANRNILVLDEGWAQLDASRSAVLGEWLNMLCKRLGLVLLLVTHQKSFEQYADVVYQVERTGDESLINRKACEIPPSFTPFDDKSCDTLQEL